MLHLSQKKFKEYLIYFAPVIVLVYLILESYQIDFRVFYVAGKSVLYPQVNKLGRFVILIPIFMPPFTNTNAILASVITLLFSISLNNTNLRKYLLKE